MSKLFTYSKRRLAVTPLEQCVQQRDLKKLKTMSSEYANVPSHLFTLAAQRDDLETLQYLYESYPDCIPSLAQGHELLKYAVINHNLPMFKFLLTVGTGISNAKMTIPYSVMYEAGKHDACDIILYMLQEVFATDEPFLTSEQHTDLHWQRRFEVDDLSDDMNTRNFLLGQCSGNKSYDRYSLVQECFTSGVSISTLTKMFDTNIITLNYELVCSLVDIEVLIDVKDLDASAQLERAKLVFGRFGIDFLTDRQKHNLFNAVCSYTTVPFLAYLVSIGFGIDRMAYHHACSHPDPEILRYVHATNMKTVSSIESFFQYSEEELEEADTVIHCAAKQALRNGFFDGLKFLLFEVKLPCPKDVLVEVGLKQSFSGMRQGRLEYRKITSDMFPLYLERLDEVVTILQQAGCKWSFSDFVALGDHIYFFSNDHLQRLLTIVFKYFEEATQSEFISTLINFLVAHNKSKVLLFELLRYHQRVSPKKFFNLHMAFKLLDTAVERGKIEIDDELIYDPQFRELMFTHFFPYHDCSIREEEDCMICLEMNQRLGEYSSLVDPFAKYLAGVQRKIDAINEVFEEEQVPVLPDIVNHVISAYL